MKWQMDRVLTSCMLMMSSLSAKKNINKEMVCECCMEGFSPDSVVASLRF